jgi:hypothetical protein
MLRTVRAQWQKTFALLLSVEGSTRRELIRPFPFNPRDPFRPRLPLQLQLAKPCC